MLATQGFRLRMIPEVKEKLQFLAERDRRTQAKMIEVLILEKFEVVQAEAKGEKNVKAKSPA